MGANGGDASPGAAALLPPGLVEGLVRRPRLEKRLGPAGGSAWSLVVGPPGAGKTTLVRGWLESYAGPWSWVSLIRAPERRQTIVDLVVRGVQAARGAPLDSLDAADMDVEEPRLVIFALVDELAADPSDAAPIALVLDDIHVLHRSEWALVEQLVKTLPPRLHLILIGRADPPMPLARERTIGRMAEIRPQDLAFDRAETDMLLQAAAPHTSLEVSGLLHDRTEGWAAGIRLAALAIRDGAKPGELICRLGDRDSSVAEFLLEEVLDRQPSDRRSFFRSVATLSILDPELCDAISGRNDSACTLRTLAAEGFFLSPIERTSERYRLHPLFADLLRAEADQVDVRAARATRLHAAQWLLANNRRTEAIEYLLAAGDFARGHRMILDEFETLYVGPHRRDLDRWLLAIPDEVVAESLDRAVEHCAALALIGHAEGARWWGYCMERACDDDLVVSRLLSVHAVYDGVRGRLEDMRARSTLARERRPSATTDPLDEVVDFWEVRLEAILGSSRFAVERGRRLVGSKRGLVPDESALSVLAGALAADAQHEAAAGVAARAIGRWRRNGEADLPGMVDALLVQAAADRLAGDLDGAAMLIDAATALTPRHDELHFLSVMVMVERARLDCAMGVRESIAACMGMAEELRAFGAPDRVVQWVERAPSTFPQTGQQAHRPVAQWSPHGTTDGGAVDLPSLTARERTILGYLAGHWTFPEIGAELCISRHTVKAHVTRIYRKLGVNSRSGAISVARDHSLLPDTGAAR